MKYKAIFLAISLIFIAASCQKQENSTNDFDRMMGMGKECYNFLETPEDYENYEFYKERFLANQKFVIPSKVSIPKVIHFVWLGPKSFPKESAQNVRSWIEHHPDWTVKFWTDSMRPLPHRKMQRQLVDDFAFTRFKKQFEESDNWGEKSDLLRYEVLYLEGGVYVDHDVECRHSFEALSDKLDLFCGIEPLHQPILSSSVSVCNNLIGSCPNHPILKQCMDLVEERWTRIQETFPGNDKESIIYRVAHRTFSAFDEAVKLEHDNADYTTLVFPSGYFNVIEKEFGDYAHHQYASLWFDDESKFEKNVRRRLFSILKKNNQIILINGVILFFNLCLLSVILMKIRRKRA